MKENMIYALEENRKKDENENENDDKMTNIHAEDEDRWMKKYV